MLDYIVVGFGLAGLAFVEHLENNHKSYIVFEDASQKSSRVAGGLRNPIVLKRFTSSWKSLEQFNLAEPFYKGIEQKLQDQLIHKLPILRRFNSVEEQNMWFEACDKPVLNQFLNAELIYNQNRALDVPYHYGEVKKTVRIDLKKMLSLYLDHIQENNGLLADSFKYDTLKVYQDYVVYDGIKAKNIVFAEGYGVKKNPFFNDLPLVGNKGEYIVIKSKDLKLTKAIKSSVFVIPLGDDLYKIGATYNHEDKSVAVTKSAQKELQKKLSNFIKVDYTIVDQEAGIRPTVRDRRPLVGVHPNHRNMQILNGLGTRGILISPWVSKNLYDHVFHGTPLDKEIDIKRFEKS